MSASASVAAFEHAYQGLRARRRWTTIGYGSLLLAALLGSAWVGEFSPGKIAAGLPRVHEYIVKILPVLTWANLWGDLQEWFYGLPKWLKLLWETILIAYLATLLGTVGAVALCFDASQNLKRSTWGYWLSRRALEVFRTIPDLVYALIFVFAFGIGPLAGILAIAIHSMGGNGKLFAEAVENIDMKPVDGLRAAGANWVQTIRYAVMPQVLPNFTSFTLWRFEINVRTASVVGFVGAGGIGHDLFTAVQLLYFGDVGAILLIIVATIMAIDILSEKFRHSAIGKASFAK